MRGLLVVTHGNLAVELVQAARKIVGDAPAMEGVSIDWDMDVDQARDLIGTAIKKLDPNNDILILTDMFGGTPTNLALSLLEPQKIEIVTGVNLPMLIKFTNLRGQMSLHEVATRIAEQGRRSIHVATEILEAKVEEPN
jgi:PTS system mannose-specific IIA component